MLVQCERLIATSGEHRGKEVAPPPVGIPAVRVGGIYRVLSVRVPAQPIRGRLPTDFALLDDHDEPTWWPAAMFSMVSGRIPPNWIADLCDGELQLGPVTWRDGFWGRYHGDDRDACREARRVFREELQVMESDDPLPADGE